MEPIKIGIVGIGMVGSALKKYFIEAGFDVYVYDINGEGSREEVNKADYIYICVPTPTIKDCCGRSTFHCDTSIVDRAISFIKGKKIIIIKSTVEPGFTERMQEARPNHRFLFNPEFLTAETTDQDMKYPDRQIIGYTEKSLNLTKEVLKQLPLAQYEGIMTTTEAEMVKYFNNIFLATKVTLANQFYDACQILNIDYERIKDAMGADKRIGRTHLNIFHGGFRGFGGSCLPKDLKAFIGFNKLKGIDCTLLEVVDKLNDKLLKNNDRSETK